MRQLVGKYSKLDVVTNPPLQAEAVWSGQTLGFLFTRLGSVWFLRMGGWCETMKIYWTKSLIPLFEPTQKSSQPSSKGLFWHQLLIWHINKSYNKPFLSSGFVDTCLFKVNKKHTKPGDILFLSTLNYCSINYDPLLGFIAGFCINHISPN